MINKTMSFMKNALNTIFLCGGLYALMFGELVVFKSGVNGVTAVCQLSLPRAKFSG